MIKIARQPLDNMISNDLKKRKIEDAKDLEHMFEDSLPPKFAFLDQVFASLERVCLLYHGRRLTTVTSIRDTLESMMSKSIEVSTLEMIETLFPSAYVYEYKRIIDPEEGSNKFEWVITPNFKQKDLLGMEKESRSRIDTFRDKLLNFAKKNQISNFMDYPMKDEFFKDVERTPLFMDCETKNGKNKSLTVDEMLLGKDHPLMKKKRETRKTYESMTLKVKNGYHESTELDLSNVPKELGDINPTLVYLSRQNEKHYQEVANPEYMEREKQRKILKSILELCERMNRYVEKELLIFFNLLDISNFNCVQNDTFNMMVPFQS